MKKSLIALAVLAASGASFAQSTVSVYGIVDAWFGTTDLKDHTGTSTKQTVLNSGGVSGSRFGLKGSEDLGGGLKANFVLEQGFSVDDGSTTAGSAFSRYATVGFSGGFGEIKLGKAGTPFDDINGNTDAVFDSKLSPMNSIFVSNSYNWNPKNTIYYATPSFSGFSAAVSYSLGEDKSNAVAVAGTTNGASNVTSINVQYAGGPLYVGFAYQTEKQHVVVGGVGLTDSESVKYTRLNGSYDFSVVKAMATYGRTAYNGHAATDWQLGLDYPVSSALTLSGSYASSKGDLINAAGTASTFGTSNSATNLAFSTNGADIKRTGWGFGANYALSKRTSIYGGYMAAKEESNASLIGFTNDAEIKYLALGVKHTF